MIGFSENRIFKIRICIKEELKLESFWLINPGPLNIFEIFECSLIPLCNLESKALSYFPFHPYYKMTPSECREKVLSLTILSISITSSTNISLVFIAVSQKFGTPFSEPSTRKGKLFPLIQTFPELQFFCTFNITLYYLQVLFLLLPQPWRHL